MNKSDLIAQLAEKKNIPAKEARTIVNTIINTMAENLAQGNNIQIRDFGSLSVKEYDAYEGRNPNTGEKMTVKAKKRTVFKAEKKLRERVNFV